MKPIHAHTLEKLIFTHHVKKKLYQFTKPVSIIRLFT